MVFCLKKCKDICKDVGEVMKLVTKLELKSKNIQCQRQEVMWWPHQIFYIRILHINYKYNLRTVDLHFR